MRLRNIHKHYLGVPVLKGVNLDIVKGELHVLLGQNGAGKSTLMKIISGSERADSGEILFKGQKVEKLTPSSAKELGIGIIHQEFALVPDLTVAENIFLGKEPVRKSGLIDEKYIYNRTRELFESLHINIDPRERVRNLGVADQQLVEIAKGVESEPEVLIFDEPTAALTLEEICHLFAFIRVLKSKGVSIIYITHKLKEVMEIADRVTVLRNGEVVSTLGIREASINEIVRMMVGREIKNEFPERAVKNIGETIFEMRNVNLKGGLHDINLTVRKGEIVGIAGVIGSGQNELANVIFGARKFDSGEIRFEGAVYKPTPQESIRRGIGYLTESRKADGLFLGHSVKQNASIASLPKFVDWWFLNARREKSKVTEILERLALKYDSLDQEVQYLSGGNQQKVVMSKWLLCDSKFLIFCEPTRGVDIGARQDVYKLIVELADQGVAVLVISTDFNEITGLCDRIYIMRHGRIVGEVENHGLDEESLTVLVVGGQN